MGLIDGLPELLPTEVRASDNPLMENIVDILRLWDKYLGFNSEICLIKIDMMKIVNKIRRKYMHTT